MQKTSRFKTTLEPDDAVVVAPVNFWYHLINTYEELSARAETVEEQEHWIDAIHHVRDWVEDTHFRPQIEEDWV